MNCEQAKNLFDRYLDGELNGSLAAELGAHKLNCASCRRELALLEVTGHMIASDTQTPSLDSEFTERLLSACRLEHRSRWYPSRRLVLFAGPSLAAAACLVFLIGHFSFPADNTGSPAVVPDVLGHKEQVSSVEELHENIQAALTQRPNDPQLRHTAEQFNLKMREIAVELENYGKHTIMEILKSIPVEESVKDSGSPPPQTSGNTHDSAVEDL